MLALKIIAIIIVAIMLILCIPVSVYAKYDEISEFKIKYLFFKMDIFPLSEKPKKEKKKKEEKKPDKDKDKKKSEKKTEKTQKDNFLVSFYNNAGFDETLKLIKDVAGVLKDYLGCLFVKHIVVKKFYLNLLVAGDDSAQTAEKFGKVCAAVCPSIAFLESNLKIKDRKINIRPDFINEENEAKFVVKINIKPFWVVNSSIYFALRLLKRFVKIAKINNQSNSIKKKFVKKSMK